MLNKWDQRFLRTAQFISNFSKDPSTKVGAVIIDSNRRIVSTGYNGFARGVKDLPERYKDRDIKIRLAVHAEINAICHAQQNLRDCCIYVSPCLCCAQCAAAVIQSGITRVVVPPVSEALRERWRKDFELTELQFKEAGVQLDIIEMV